MRESRNLSSSNSSSVLTNPKFVMGTNDSVYTTKRGIAKISRNSMTAGTAPATCTNLMTKFLFLIALITLVIYVLADQVSPAQRDVSLPYQIHPIEPRPVSTLLSVSAPSAEKDVGSEKVKNEDEEVILSDHKRQRMERNIENMCNNTVAGWGSKTDMHDILTYISVLEKPITYLDVGANVGSTSLPALVCFRAKHRVIAVEPVKMNYQAIVNGKNGILMTKEHEERIVVANVGLSNETKKTTMWIPGRRGDNAALDQKASSAVIKDELREEEVQVYRGDEFLKMHKEEPKLIKIDVQGSEIRVLRGMEGYLKKQEELLIMAEHEYKMIKGAGFGVYDVYNYMKGLGFKVFHKPKVTVKDDEFWVDSDEVDRKDVPRFSRDLVFWKSASV